MSQVVIKGLMAVDYLLTVKKKKKYFFHAILEKTPQSIHKNVDNLFYYLTIEF